MTKTPHAFRPGAQEPKSSVVKREQRTTTILKLISWWDTKKHIPATVEQDIYRRLKIQIKVQEPIHCWLPSILKSGPPQSHTWGLSCSIAVIYAIHGPGLMTVIRWWSCIHHFCPSCTGQMDPDHPSPVRDASVHTAARGTNKSLASPKGQCQLDRAQHKNWCCQLSLFFLSRNGVCFLSPNRRYIELTFFFFRKVKV